MDPRSEISLETQRTAIENISRAIASQYHLSLGEKPRIQVGTNLPMTLEDIREQIAKLTPLGCYHAKIWAMSDGEVHAIQRAAFNSAKPL